MEAEPDIEHAQRLDQPGAVERAGLFDGKSGSFDQLFDGTHGCLVIPGEEDRDGRSLVGRQLEEAGKNGVVRFDDLGSCRSGLQLFSRRCAVADCEAREIGLERIADVDHDLAREVGAADELQGGGIGQGDHDDIGPGDGGVLVEHGDAGRQGGGESGGGGTVATGQDQVGLPGEALAKS